MMNGSLQSVINSCRLRFIFCFIKRSIDSLWWQSTLHHLRETGVWGCESTQLWKKKKKSHLKCFLKGRVLLNRWALASSASIQLCSYRSSDSRHVLKLLSVKWCLHSENVWWLAGWPDPVKGNSSVHQHNDQYYYLYVFLWSHLSVFIPIGCDPVEACSYCMWLEISDDW